jgi:UDP-3-O-[3-hydroxymyristoyl] glucosamine N-acyltransferase
MALKLKELAAQLGGEVVGDGEVLIERVAAIESAGPGEITFVSNEKYVGFMRTTQASALIVNPRFRSVPKNLIVLANPYLGFARAVRILMHRDLPRVPGVHPTAIIAPTARLGQNAAVGARVVIDEEAQIGDNVTIMAGSYIGHGVAVGDDTLIHPNATLYHGVRIGKRCVIHSGVIVGCDGFGWAPVDPKSGRPYEAIPQVGISEIGDDVSIGAGSVINRGALANTVIRRGTKIDSLVIIGHNTDVGEDCLLVSQVGVSGSVKIGNHVTLGGQVGVAGHLKIGDNVAVAAQSGVSGNLEANGAYFGSPARPMYEMKRTVAALHKLPELRDEIRQVQKRMAQITALLDTDVAEALKPAQ